MSRPHVGEGTLPDAASAALAHVTDESERRASVAWASIQHVIEMSDVPQSVFEEAFNAIMKNARVALHFHPDRPGGSGRTVAEELVSTGCYKNQFETKRSNGGLSAYPGGDRDEWERRLFGGAYHTAAASAEERPKYGALDLLCSPDGPSPRFGSCYLLLPPNVSQRCTFTYLDSHLEPLERGTYKQFADVFAALLLESFQREAALGQHGLRPRALLETLRERLELPKGIRVGEPVRSLDHYIEAQVHGPVQLARDAECLVADASFEAAPTGDVLRELCRRFGLELVWQGGFSMEASAMPSDFRGPTMPSLAQRVAVASRINAKVIGQAVLDVHQNPAAWSDRGREETVLLELKRLWHVLVRYGRYGTR